MYYVHLTHAQLKEGKLMLYSDRICTYPTLQLLSHTASSRPPVFYQLPLTRSNPAIHHEHPPLLPIATDLSPCLASLWEMCKVELRHPLSSISPLPLWLQWPRKKRCRIASSVCSSTSHASRQMASNIYTNYSFCLSLCTLSRHAVRTNKSTM